MQYITSAYGMRDSGVSQLVRFGVRWGECLTQGKLQHMRNTDLSGLNPESLSPPLEGVSWHSPPTQGPWT